MATVKLDLIEGARVVERNGDVIEHDRIATVRGVGTFDSGTPLDFFSATGLPVAGDQHPALSNLILEDRTLRRAVGADYAELVLSYRRHYTTADWFASGTVSLRQVTRTKDLNDAEVTVTHDVGPPVTAPFSADEQFEDIFIEIVEATDTPGATARSFANKINSAIWLGDAVGLWRCTNVTYAPAILTTSPQKWRFGYSFAYDPNGHQPTVFYIDGVNGKPPDPLVDGVSRKSVTHYDSVDFNTKFT